ncbi:protein CREG1-like [Xenia sp. Carnegie-2017]|uniref:protein CREG1-like n=1 Tax=Xenia sp. Carnegie-2017 TaxID=2897299 RepID=UPI001F03E7E7|nr:protein CREG1-like [Xenia sp. Carnegie-2017]
MDSYEKPLFAELRECNKAANSKTRMPSRSIVTLVLVLLVILIFLPFAIYFISSKYDNFQHLSKFDPPPRDDIAKTARYAVHNLDWGVISTISIEFGGFPSGRPVSVADGPMDNSTGIPYIYIAPATPTSHDLQFNTSASLSFSEAMSDYCSRNQYIAEDPRCARITLYGNIVKVGQEEIPFAKKSLFSRNPIMKRWPASHKFYFAKLEISHVRLLDYFGPCHEIPLKDYFAAKV